MKNKKIIIIFSILLIILIVGGYFLIKHLKQNNIINHSNCRRILFNKTFKTK